jgi:hypothetical protein
MDFVGHWLPHRVVLKWWHGRKAQGGVGSYYPEYPKHLYNPLANPPPKENSPAHVPSESEEHGHGGEHPNGHGAEHPSGPKPEPGNGHGPEGK